MSEPKRTLKQVMKELNEYNITHERSLTYGKYIKMLEAEEKKPVIKSKKKPIRAGNKGQKR